LSHYFDPRLHVALHFNARMEYTCLQEYFQYLPASILTPTEMGPFRFGPSLDPGPHRLQTTGFRLWPAKNRGAGGRGQRSGAGSQGSGVQGFITRKSDDYIAAARRFISRREMTTVGRPLTSACET